jgi:hypothetical protein
VQEAFLEVVAVNDESRAESRPRVPAVERAALANLASRFRKATARE